jgi:hypothetical protein
LPDYSPNIPKGSGLEEWSCIDAEPPRNAGLIIHWDDWYAPEVCWQGLPPPLSADLKALDGIQRVTDLDTVAYDADAVAAEGQHRPPGATHALVFGNADTIGLRDLVNDAGRHHHNTDHGPSLHLEQHP